MTLLIEMRFEKKEIDLDFKYDEYRILGLVQMISIEQNVWLCRWQHIVKKKDEKWYAEKWLIEVNDLEEKRDQYSNVLMQDFSILIQFIFFSSLESESLRLKISFF